MHLPPRLCLPSLQSRKVGGGRHCASSLSSAAVSSSLTVVSSSPTIASSSPTIGYLSPVVAASGRAGQPEAVGYLPVANLLQLIRDVCLWHWAPTRRRPRPPRLLCLYPLGLQASWCLVSQISSFLCRCCVVAFTRFGLLVLFCTTVFIVSLTVYTPRRPLVAHCRTPLVLVGGSLVLLLGFLSPQRNIVIFIGIV